MSYDVSLDGYPPEAYSEREAIKRAGAWAFNSLYGVQYEDGRQPLYSALVSDTAIDILTYTESPNLLLTIGQPYSEIVVMATLQLQERICRLVGWEYSEEIRDQFYPPKIIANRLCNYIHASRLQHMSLLEDLLGLVPSV